MSLIFEPNWLVRLTDKDRQNKLNTETDIKGLFSAVKLERGDRTKANVVLSMLRSGEVDVIVYKGLHQSKYFSNNPLDNSRIDQAHFNVLIQGVAYHVYVQPSLSGKFEITEISSKDRSPLEGVLAGSGAFND